MPSPVVVCDLGLLSNSCSRMPGPAEVQDSGLLSQWSPPYTCSCGVLSPPACSVTGGWFRPVSVDVPGLGPFLRRFLPWTCSHDVQQVLWLRSTLSELQDVCLDPQRSQVSDYSLCGCSLVPAPVSSLPKATKH